MNNHPFTPINIFTFYLNLIITQNMKIFNKLSSPIDPAASSTNQFPNGTATQTSFAPFLTPLLRSTLLSLLFSPNKTIRFDFYHIKPIKRQHLNFQQEPHCERRFAVSAPTLVNFLEEFYSSDVSHEIASKLTGSGLMGQN